MIGFKQYLKAQNSMIMEGGNVVVQDKSGKNIPAEKIDLSKFNRNKFTSDMIKAFENLNKMFEKKYGYPIWKTTQILKTGFAFNGSAQAFFDPTIPDELFKEVKPKVGDIDLTVPQEIKKPIWEMLNKMKGKKLAPNVIYVGDNAPNYSPNNHQINAVVEYKDGKNTVYAQVDFELTPYDGRSGKPNEFTKFAHSSDWNDMKEGIKGVHHKFLLRSLAGGMSVRDDIVIATAKATPEKPRLMKMSDVPHMLAFAVDKGLRDKYVAQYLPDGKPWIINGKHVYKEQESELSKYETTVEGMFKIMFAEPQGKKDLQDMWSFVGVLQLMKRYHDKKQVETTLKRLVDLYWSPRAQGLERNNPELDMAIKDAGWKMVVKIFPYMKSYQSTVDKMKKEYYKKYKMTAISL